MNYTEKFDSLQDFLQAIKTRKTSKNLEGAYLSSLNDSEEKYKETTTHNLAEANDLLMYGDNVNASKLLQEKAKIEKAYQLKQSTCRDYAGFIPCVPAYLSGQPRNMINIRKKAEQAPKVLDVNITIGVSVSYSTKEIINAGAKVLTAINQLEINQYRTNIYIYKINSHRKDLYTLRIKLKSSGEPLNVLKIAYPLVNPSMQRRHCFRWFETIPNINKTFTRHYGYTEKANNSISITEIIDNSTSVDDIVKQILRLNNIKK